MSFWLGFPVISKMICNWLRVVFPGNKDCLLTSSAKIQPAAQMSIEVEYFVKHKMSYGAR